MLDAFVSILGALWHQDFVALQNPESVIMIYFCVTFLIWLESALIVAIDDGLQNQKSCSLFSLCRAECSGLGWLFNGYWLFADAFTRKYFQSCYHYSDGRTVCYSGSGNHQSCC